MPTTKTRIHLTLDDPFIEDLIEKLVKAKKSTKSRQANDLIRLGVESLEDSYLESLALDRDTKDAEFVDFSSL